jgi:two-component system sensor histidine kinase KdpD
LLNRLARGVIYAPERAEAALQNFFKESTLVALRELAMRQAAYAVESRLPGDEEPSTVGATSVAASPTRERLLLLVGPDPSSAWFASALVQRIVHLARDMQVTVVADRSTPHVAA